jgi:HEAT repeat protein
MDTTTKKIVKLLDDERMERRCAAVMVLGELGAKEPQVIEAIGRCLDQESHLLRLYALEALAGAKSPKVIQLVIPLLDDPDEEVRSQAAALLANQGSKAAAKLAKELHGAPIGRRRTIVSILARNHDKGTFERLLVLLPDPEIGEYTLNALRSEIDQMSAKEGEALRGQLAALLKDKEWLADSTCTARALRLLGYMREAKLVRTILPFTADKKPVPVRLAALAALRRPLQAARDTDETVKALLQHADDPDATLARAVVDTLRGLKVPDGLTKELMKLSQGRHSEARQFALEALGQTGGQPAIKNMVKHLWGDDPAARAAAARSLGKLEAATPILLKELTAKGGEVSHVRVLCGLLRHHAASLKPAARKTVADLTIVALEQGAGTAEPLLELLAAVEPKRFAEVLVSRAVAHKKAKRHDQAFALLCHLDGADLLDDDGRYLAALTGLCALSAKKDLGRASRTTHPILKQIVELVGIGYPVASKLKKEKSLTPEDLFFVGFNFSESKDEEEKAFGGELLERLASKGPRTKLGRAAKNKLKLMGLA